MVLNPNPGSAIKLLYAFSVVPLQSPPVSLSVARCSQGWFAAVVNRTLFLGNMLSLSSEVRI